MSNVTIYTNRTLTSVYINNGTRLLNPQNLSFGTENPWIPVAKLYTNNSQPFLWLNSSNLTTLTNIPTISINQSTSHWFSILISQWNDMTYQANQVAVAFIVNRTIIFDFLIFNASQTNITTWFSLRTLLSNQYWNLTQYSSTVAGQTQMKSIYTDSDCIRSFNFNLKYSTSRCTQDFYGFFFVDGGYKDLCTASSAGTTSASVPTIYYSPTTYSTNGSLSDYHIADGLMVFVR
ncbi:unnamed protein product [Rotaria socialis]|nr:unnamed protein product [Rotaria socialis]CAF4263588.1 unnamed protein product [Rotaria socialis]CAF4273648.1 unnamed protein product [Rotaria socialis]CAF4491289.1 unnamed protein product [Rotaria socialis]CAF4837432.1 unnamed protein product [Rotaria socialis]